MQIENIFPVPLATFELPQDILDNSLSKSKIYMDSKKWKEQRHYGRTITSYFEDTTRNYLGNFDHKLGNLVNLRCREYLEYIGYNPNADLMIESWLNLNPPDTHHSRHEHFGCFMGGVIWLSAVDDSGNFVIHDPVGVRAQNASQYRFAKTKNTTYSNDIYFVYPKPGTMIMFPSWLQHQVESNKTNEDRISIAFNVWMKD